jgi:hypothetical protein
MVAAASVLTVVGKQIWQAEEVYKTFRDDLGQLHVGHNLLTRVLILLTLTSAGRNSNGAE